MAPCPACKTDLAVPDAPCERHGWWRNYVMALQLLWGCGMDTTDSDEFYVCNVAVGNLADLLDETPEWLMPLESD